MVWHSGDNEYWFDPGTLVRVRIEKESWSSQNDAPAPAIDENEDAKARSRVPYSIEASMAEPGLGGIDWW